MANPKKSESLSGFWIFSGPPEINTVESKKKVLSRFAGWRLGPIRPASPTRLAQPDRPGRPDGRARPGWPGPPIRAGPGRPAGRVRPAGSGRPGRAGRPGGAFLGASSHCIYRRLSGPRNNNNWNLKKKLEMDFGLCD